MAKHLLVVVGPTAIGKTAMAIALAQHYNCEIISADSRQFFKEMSIGTAVPSQQELNAVPHHFIHNKSVLESYTVGDFEKEVLEKLDALYQKYDSAVLVGGSGLYIDAVLKGLDEFPDVDLEIRDLINLKFHQLGIGYLQKELQKRDPVYYETVDKENPQRMMRALEVCKTAGRPYSSVLNIKKRDRNFTPIMIGIEADRKIIYDRINRRVDQMLADGFIDEATALLPHKKLNALQTVGYREIFSFLEGDFSKEFAISEVKKNTRRFAKRQLTWFRRNGNVTWFDCSSDLKLVCDHIDVIARNP